MSLPVECFIRMIMMVGTVVGGVDDLLGGVVLLFGFDRPEIFFAVCTPLIFFFLLPSRRLIMVLFAA